MAHQQNFYWQCLFLFSTQNLLGFCSCKVNTKQRNIQLGYGAVKGCENPVRNATMGKNGLLTYSSLNKFPRMGQRTKRPYSPSVIVGWLHADINTHTSEKELWLMCCWTPASGRTCVFAKKHQK